MNCPFCPLKKKTEWFYQSEDGIVVCRDLNPKGYKYRILVVGSGEKWHRPLANYSPVEIDRLVNLGRDIANQHIKEGKAKEIAEIDTVKHSYPDHWHCQICMR